MPIYEYKCENNHTFERILVRPTTISCPFCGGKKVEKVVSKPSKPVIKGYNSKNNYGLK